MIYMQETYKNQVVNSGVVISVGYLSNRSSYQKYCEVNEIKTGESISHLLELHSWLEVGISCHNHNFAKIADMKWISHVFEDFKSADP